MSGNNLHRRIKSFGFAFAGLAYLIRSQANAKIHAGITILVIILSIVMKLSQTEWVMIIFAIGFVFAAEAFNTAIEIWVDKLEPGFDRKAGTAKDLAAASVLIAALTAATIGLIIFIPKMF